MKVAVLGATGFVGRHVLEALKGRGHQPLPFGRQRIASVPGARVWDVTIDEAPSGALEGCEAIVNLVGIKREADGRTFEAAHVIAARRVVTAAHAHGIRRVVHVSVVCARPDPVQAYHDTKWRAEQVLRESGLAVTILRPAVIYGPGDDMLTHLVRMVRFAPLFPVVGDGTALLQAVDVRDVAEAVVRALESPAAAGHTYDVVGPDRLPLRGIVRTVAEALGLRIVVLPTPPPLMRAAVRVMNRLFPNPLSTPSQLRMLEEGLVGDAEPARRDLGLAPRPFTASAIRDVVAPIAPLFGMSLRLVDGPAQASWLATYAARWRGASALAFAAVAASIAASFTPFGVWIRMLLVAALVVPLALALVPLNWARLVAPRPRSVGLGVAAAALLYPAGLVVVRLLQAFPATAAQVATLYGWRDQAPAGWAPVLLPLLVLAEDLVWRGAVTLPLSGRFGAWRGVLAASVGFALAHVALGVPVLPLAALLAGAFWSALVVRSRSLLAPFLSHLLWDAAVLFWWPYSA